MKQALAKTGVATADIEKISDKFDAEKITEIVEDSSNPKEAFEALHAFYPELEVEAMQKQCDFVVEQLEAAMKEKKQGEPMELTEDELENVAGGGWFSDWFNGLSSGWKKVVVGAAIVVGAALVCTGVGAAIGSQIVVAGTMVGTEIVAVTMAGTGAAMGAVAGTMLGCGAALMTVEAVDALNK